MEANAAAVVVVAAKVGRKSERASEQTQLLDPQSSSQSQSSLPSSASPCSTTGPFEAGLAEVGLAGSVSVVTRERERERERDRVGVLWALVSQLVGLVLVTNWPQP